MTNETKKPPTLIGSQDLLTYFNLIPIYNKVVKPYPLPDRAAGLDPTLFPYISDLPGKKKKRERYNTIYKLLVFINFYLFYRQNGYGT